MRIDAEEVVPKDTYVSMRMGDYQKQSRFFEIFGIICVALVGCVLFWGAFQIHFFKVSLFREANIT